MAQKDARALSNALANAPGHTELTCYTNNSFSRSPIKGFWAWFSINSLTCHQLGALVQNTMHTGLPQPTA